MRPFSSKLDAEEEEEEEEYGMEFKAWYFFGILLKQFIEHQVRIISANDKNSYREIRIVTQNFKIWVISGFIGLHAIWVQNKKRPFLGTKKKHQLWAKKYLIGHN